VLTVVLPCQAYPAEFFGLLGLLPLVETDDDNFAIPWLRDDSEPCNEAAALAYPFQTSSAEPGSD